MEAVEKFVMMKKKILIIFTGPMEIGGIERSLLALLDAIDYSKYDVDLFLYAHHGVYYKKINPNVHILPEVRELAYLREGLAEKLKHGCFYSVYLRVLDELKYKHARIPHERTWAKIVHKKAPSLKEHYQLAVSFFRPFDYLKEKVQADVKVGWVHTDYSLCDQALNEELQSDYSGLDYIAAVSEKSRQMFCERFPQFSERTLVIENILSADEIRREADSIDVSREMPNDGSIRFLSVGRFCKEKNFHNIPDMCKKLLQSDLNVKWYLIGYGQDVEYVREKIKETGMEQYVIMLGKKENPYPYMKECDYYIQPSRFEGKCVAVREAQILGKPVIITNYPTASSQIQNGVDGIIVPLNNEECAAGIRDYLKNKRLRETIVHNLAVSDFSNKKEVEKLYVLIPD